MDIKYMLACIFMSMGPAKHEKVAIFRRKMSDFECFSGLRKHKVRSNVQVSWAKCLLTLISVFMEKSDIHIGEIHREDRKSA